MQTLKLLKLCFFLTMYLHCEACFWFLIVKNGKLWIPTIHYALGGTYIFESGAVT